MRLLIAIAAGVVGYCYYRGREAHLNRPVRREELHRWEDEGGNVPAVATPRPAAPLQATGGSGTH